MRPTIHFAFCVLLGVSASAQQVTPDNPPSLGCWPFDGHAQDLSGKNNHGTIYNAVPTRNRFGQSGMALYFNGVNAGVVVPHSTSIDMQQGQSFTFTYWQKAYPGNTDAVVITKHTYGNWDGYNFIANNQANSGYCTSLNHMYWYVASGGLQDACSDGPVLGDTAWHFLAGVYDAINNRSYFYVDAVLQQDVGGSSGTLANPADLAFGYDADIADLYFHGALDDACLYNGVLSYQQITDLYGRGPLSLANMQVTRAISVFPNPANGRITVNMAFSAPDLNVRVVSGLGQLLKEVPIGDDGVDLDLDLPPGVYTVMICKGSERLAQQRLVVN